MEKGALRAFHTLVVGDPLFAAEGMDIENASHALDEIEASLLKIEKAYTSGSFIRRLFFIRYPLSRYAVPIVFLRSFIESERSRREYLGNPTFVSARRLARSWRKASRSFSLSAARYRTLHRIIFRLEVDAHAFISQDFFGYTSSHEYIEKTLDTLSHNGKELENLTSIRTRLLDSSNVVMHEPRPNATTASFICEKGVVSPWHSHIHAQEIAGGVSPFRHVDILETHGPLRYTLSHFNGKPTPHVFMLYVLRNKKTGVKNMWVALIDVFFLSNLWGMKEKRDGVTRGKFAFFAGLSPKDMPYWYEPGGHLYETRDQRYWMEIATHVDLERRPELDHNLVYAQKSSMFDLILGECALDTRLFINQIERRIRGGIFASSSVLYDLLMRSFPSIYYMTFNQSVWRLPESPSFLGDGFESIYESLYLSEAEARTALTPDVLAKVMSAQRIREERGRREGWLS